MSGCLCKKAEGTVFPLLVEAMGDGVDDPLDAEFVDEADHPARSAAHHPGRWLARCASRRQSRRRTRSRMSRILCTQQR
jgi:hypothetical protein